MRIPLPAARRKARIEIIPLIDIVFFLLATFVMVSMSMVKNQGISVNLPKAATGTAQEIKKSAIVSVSRDGRLYLNKESVGMDALRSKLIALKSEDPELRVFIQGDEGASFGSAVHALDEIRKVGLLKVSIQTKEKDQG